MKKKRISSLIENEIFVQLEKIMEEDGRRSISNIVHWLLSDPKIVNKLIWILRLGKNETSKKVIRGAIEGEYLRIREHHGEIVKTWGEPALSSSRSRPIESKRGIENKPGLQVISGGLSNRDKI